MLFSTAGENAATSGVIRYRISILWFILFAIFGTWLLARTQFGNWTFAVGGNKEAARAEGVPRPGPRPRCSCWSPARRG